MARCLIVGCGCRGLALAGALRERGHAVRGTTRDPARADALRAAGVEPFVGDPDRVATLVPAFAQVAVTCVLLGSATADPQALTALHTTRLEMLLEKMIDTTSRGIVYEAAGTVDAQLLAGGAERVRHACARSLIPFALLEVAPETGEAAGWTAARTAAWTAAAAAAVDEVLLGAQPAP